MDWKAAGRISGVENEDENKNFRYLMLKQSAKFCLFLARQPPVGQGLLIHEISRSHAMKYHRHSDSSGRVISSSRRPLPDNTQHSQKTNNHDPGAIRTYSLSRRAVVDLRLIPCGHWDRQTGKLDGLFLKAKKTD
jgi:hypothetical protein